MPGHHSVSLQHSKTANLPIPKEHKGAGTGEVRRREGGEDGEEKEECVAKPSHLSGHKVLVVYIDEVGPGLAGMPGGEGLGDGRRGQRCRWEAGTGGRE